MIVNNLIEAVEKVGYFYAWLGIDETTGEGGYELLYTPETGWKFNLRKSSNVVYLPSTAIEEYVGKHVDISQLKTELDRVILDHVAAVYLEATHLVPESSIIAHIEGWKDFSKQLVTLVDGLLKKDTLKIVK